MDAGSTDNLTRNIGREINEERKCEMEGEGGLEVGQQELRRRMAT